jgi:hypothetical protein
MERTCASTAGPRAGGVPESKLPFRFMLFPRARGTHSAPHNSFAESRRRPQGRGFSTLSSYPHSPRRRHFRRPRRSRQTVRCSCRLAATRTSLRSRRLNSPLLHRWDRRPGLSSQISTPVFRPLPMLGESFAAQVIDTTTYSTRCPVTRHPQSNLVLARVLVPVLVTKLAPGIPEPTPQRQAPARARAAPMYQTALA